MITQLGMKLFEAGLLPDLLIRQGIQKFCWDRLKAESQNGDVEMQQKKLMEWVNTLSESVVAEKTDAANEQHYEVPSDMYLKCLGNVLKYSCCLYENENTTLDQAEIAMLELYIKRAQLTGNQKVLELGCGWGSFTLFYAERFPSSTIVGISNSSSQREFIMKEAKKRNLTNIDIITCDVNHFTPSQGDFDRIVSIEMFEHIRNYKVLLSRISTWLKPTTGLLFIHIFTHKKYAYPYDDSDEDDSNWMAREFFSGGQMPSQNLLLYFQDDVSIVNQWAVNGLHYWRTCEDWLKKFDSNSNEIYQVFLKGYGSEKEARKRVRYWRVFFMSCAELFRWEEGTEW